MLWDFLTDWRQMSRPRILWLVTANVLCSSNLRGNWNLDVIFFVGHSEGFTRNTDFNGSEIYASHKINLHQNIKWILVYIFPIWGQIYSQSWSFITRLNLQCINLQFHLPTFVWILEKKLISGVSPMHFYRHEWSYIVGISACAPSENPEASFCLGRHPSQFTEYWLYYETWGVFHNVLHFYRII